MSAAKAINMRNQEGFPLEDLYSLNLEDYIFDSTGNIELPVKTDESLSMVGSSVDGLFTQSEDSLFSTLDIFRPGEFELESTIFNLPQYTSPPSTPGIHSPTASTSGHVTPGHATPGQTTPGQTTPGRTTPGATTSGPTTPGFTPLSSPYGSVPSSPGNTVKKASSAASSSGKDTQSKQKIPRHKRKSHIDAEYRRRSKIQSAFDELKTTVPALSGHNSKDSKSAILNKTTEFCRQLRGESKGLKQEADKLRLEMQALTSQITDLQRKMPASGVTEATDEPTKSVESMFDDYLRARTLTNWKFWIFGLIIRPIFEKFNKSVVTTSSEAFCASVANWVQSCMSLVSLRPVLLNALRHMSKTTSIMSAPERVEEEVMETAIESALEAGSGGSGVMEQDSEEPLGAVGTDVGAQADSNMS